MLRPRGRDPVVADPAAAGIDQRWTRTSRADRLARVAGADLVATTGTVRLTFEVVDDRPFAFTPGQFVGMEYAVERLGYRRSPYCLLSATPDRRFELLVRVVEGGTVSRYLGSLRVGDEVGFRGPTGRSMVPRDLTRHIVMLAPGVGVAPSYFLARSLLREGFAPPIDLYWGLRLADDLPHRRAGRAGRPAPQLQLPHNPLAAAAGVGRAPGAADRVGAPRSGHPREASTSPSRATGP